jgi:hypothetical protein
MNSCPPLAWCSSWVLHRLAHYRAMVQQTAVPILEAPTTRRITGDSSVDRPSPTSTASWRPSMEPPGPEHA